MLWNNGYFFGMNFIWWVLWAAILVTFFSFATPVPRRRMRDHEETPLETLRRRLAKGEITLADYEERQALILRDSGDQARVRSARIGDQRKVPPPSIPVPH